MRMIQRSLCGGLMLAVGLLGCSMVPTSPVAEGQACTDDGRCAKGYACNRITNACIKDDGSGCPDADRDGVTTCEHDCDDTEPTCTTDCTSDTDDDSIIDCLDTCVDVDRDGLGNGTNNNSGCADTSTDCDEESDLCTTTCDDVDDDGDYDCKDTCVDADGDGYGVDGGGGTCAGADCSDEYASCINDCTDLDDDDIPDCGDTCVDVDKDGFGNGTNGNSGCDDTSDDCDEESDLCTTTCDDVDLDDVWDCKDTCVDADGDGVGDGTLGNSGCLVQNVDSNDEDPEACADTDADTCDDCASQTFDPANDGVDIDEDGTCDRTDCKDNDDSCTTDCTACPPAGLVVRIENAPLCEPATVTIDLDAYTGAAADLTCKSGDAVHGVTLDGPTTFANEDWGSWGVDVTSGTVELELWRDFDGLNCSNHEGDYFAHFDMNTYIELGKPLDLTGWENVRIEFQADYRDKPNAGDNLRVLSCCGSDCSPPADQVGEPVLNANDGPGGTDACQSVTRTVVDGENCPNLMLRIEFDSTKGEAAVDDIKILGHLMFSSIAETAQRGVYETTATSCLATSDPVPEPVPVPVTCYWPDATDPVVSDDSETIEWQ